MVAVAGGRSGAARFAYRVYSITPFELIDRAARAAHRTSKTVKDPILAELHRMTAYRFDFDLSEHLDQWQTRTEQVLTFCDAAMADGISDEDLAELLFHALILVFHPNVSQGTVPSPFVESPLEAGRILSHRCMQLLRSDLSGDAADEESAGLFPVRASDEPVHLLVMTETNFNFMGPILDTWRHDPSVSLRVRDLSSEDVDSSWWSPQNTILDRIRGSSPTPPAFLVEDLEWADVVFLEWSQALAARLSGVRLRGRLVIRLHRYEAFTQEPTLTDWRNVDELIIITPYMRELLDRTLPGVAMKTSISMVPNVIELQGLRERKLAVASRTLALIQYGSIVKDPIWALDVLEILRRTDPSWRLLLVGAAPNTLAADEATIRYFTAFERRLAQFDGSVQRLGHRDDLPDVLREVGFILSTSRVEGAPVSLLEGIASGAIPVVRDWPIVRAIGGAAALYPAEWIVETPEDAARRILDQAPDSDTGLEAREYLDWAARHSDSSVNLSALNQVVFGTQTRLD
ncbi:MAG: glycosyltransferase [Candidatus Leucobacter sulfamidivorax]|nr:glycosyltransferase [Candidatus Leucobacter sulfamidivorax]